MQLGIAMHNYADTHGTLPPAVVYGKDGRPLYSWRVLVLPYIEQDDLYKQFKLDEPWDSPHNIELLERMPRTYAPPRYKQWKVPPHHTVIKVFHGKGAAFEGANGVKFDDFPDGTSNTLLIVEAGEPVPWTAPRELEYDPGGPLPRLDCLFDWGFRAAWGDGSIRYIRKETSEESLRAAITRNGGEQMGSDW